MHQIITIKYNCLEDNPYNKTLSFLKNSGLHKMALQYLTLNNLDLFRAELFLRKNNPFIQFTPLILSFQMPKFVKEDIEEKFLNLILQFSKLDNVFILNMFYESDKPHYSFKSAQFLESISVKTINVNELETLKIEPKEGLEHSFLDLRRGVFRHELPLQIKDLIYLVQEGIISKRNDMGLLSMISSQEKEEILIELKEKELIVGLIRGECV